MQKNFKQTKKSVLPVRRNIALILVLLMGRVGFSVSAASTWKGPGAAPLGLSGIKPILDLSDFIELTKPSEYEWTVPLTATYQWVTGALHLSATGDTPSTGDYPSVLAID